MDTSGVNDRQAFLARALRAAVDGPAWHGPALVELPGRWAPPPPRVTAAGWKLAVVRRAA